MDTADHPVNGWGATAPKDTYIIPATEFDSIVARVYHKAHLHGFLMGIAAGCAIGAGIVGALLS